MGLFDERFMVSPGLKRYLDSLPGSRTKILDDEVRFKANFDEPVPDDPGPDGSAS